jgi:hypothetical protein
MTAGECQRCAWPVDRTGVYKTIDGFKWAMKEGGTAPFPKSKEYQNLKVGAYDPEKGSESEIALYTTNLDDRSEEAEEDVEEEEDDEEEDEEEAADEGQK